MRRPDACAILYAFGHVPTAVCGSSGCAKVHRSLKPGGLLLFDVFNLNDRHEVGPQRPEGLRAPEPGRPGATSAATCSTSARAAKGTAFLHYFEEPGYATCWPCGFRVERLLRGYTHRSGHLLQEPMPGPFRAAGGEG